MEHLNAIIVRCSPGQNKEDVEINMLLVGMDGRGVGVPKRQAGGAHLATAHSPEVSASCCLLFFFVSGLPTR